MILGLNIDHIATIRNARNSSYPSIIRACEDAKSGGAEIITIHLREDRRHIRDNDAEEICRSNILPVNLEIAQTGEMISIATRLKPKFVCIVPENRMEITTEGGLDVFSLEDELKKRIKILKDSQIQVSLFIEPNKNAVLKAKEIGADTVEFHTGQFAINQEESEFLKIKTCALLAKDLGLNVHAGHGLNFDSAAALCAIEEISVLHIGHFLITESIFTGLTNAVKMMKERIN